jgi:ketosteroid isomerase-like protein
MDVAQTLAALNAAWQNRRFQELWQFFDDDAVMIGPDLKAIVRGRDALVQSYADFMQECAIVAFDESNHSVDMWGDVAAASYDWAMTYQRAGRTATDTGHELFVFRRRDSEWLAVLRLMTF